jgi:hypothetical protein
MVGRELGVRNLHQPAGQPASQGASQPGAVVGRHEYEYG